MFTYDPLDSPPEKRSRMNLASYSTPPSSSKKRKYGNYVLGFIDDELVENLDYNIFRWKIID
jgi:hypothetical protein